MPASKPIPASAAATEWKPTFIGSLGGVAIGLFFGDACDVLAPLADAYIRLLQMTVLPLVVTMLVASIGRLNPSQAKELSFSVGVTTVASWLLGATLLVLAIYALPDWQGGQFYSRNLVTPADSSDLISQYIPTNPFAALAESSIPSVVLFCIFFGVALMTVPNKAGLIAWLDNATDALTQVNRIVLRVNPIGIFILSAKSAGTLQFPVFEKLEAYFVITLFLVLFLTFWVIPQLVSIFTPVSYREVLGISRTFLITVVVVGKLIVVLPLIIDAIQTLFNQHRLNRPEVSSTVEAVVPLSYPFPGIGSFVTLFFIPFAGWYVGQAFGLAQVPKFLSLGLATSFAQPMVSLPFLLRGERLPTDLIDLYVVAWAYLRYGSLLLAAMELFGLGLVATAINCRLFHVNWTRAVRFLTCTSVLLLVSLGSIRWYLAREVTSYQDDSTIMDMQSMWPDRDMNVNKQAAPNPVPLAKGQTRLDRVKKTGVVRIGYNAGSMPFSFINSQGQLVGLDIDIVSSLVTMLDCKIEFVPYEKGKLLEGLRQDHFDFAVSDLSSSVQRVEIAMLTSPYMQVHLALVVHDSRVPEFQELHHIRSMPALRVAAVRGSIYTERAKRLFPFATLVELDSDEEFFHGTTADVLLTSAEVGASWAMVYTPYQVVDPFPTGDEIPLAYAVGFLDQETFQSAFEWREFLNNWLLLKRSDGTVEQLYQYWVKGDLPARYQQPRWSILADVLGWKPSPEKSLKEAAENGKSSFED